MSAGTGKEAVARSEGPNGVRVEIHDESSPYGYANLYRVSLRVVAKVPGAEAPYERSLDRLGVSGGDLASVRDELLARFRRNVLPYLFSPEFPRRFSDRLVREGSSRVLRFPAAL